MAPPKPRLVLRIGVTGHRPNRFAPGAQAIVAAKLDMVLHQIGDTLARLHHRYVGVFSPEPPLIRVASALAEGTDRLMAHAALNAGLPLDVILPFPPEVYDADFETAQSKAEFADLLRKAEACFVLPGGRSDSDSSGAVRAYEAVGLMTLRQADLIVTVWDGEDTAGRGGTGSIVQSALSSGQPVLRFDAKGEGPFLLSGNDTALSDARDVVSRSRTAAEDQDIAAVVDRLCAPPDAEGNTEAAMRLRRFLKEREHRLLFSAFWYPAILSLFSQWRGFGKTFWRPSFVAGAKADWQTYWAGLSALDAGLKRRIGDVVLARFAWADRLADHYGQLHRSGYISNYLFSALAVVFAALGGFLAEHDQEAGLQWFAILEMTVIVFIGITVARGHWSRWHTRWLDYRHLSGQLRALRALVLTGSSTGEARSPHAGEPVEPGSQWTAWYCRLTAREVGLPNFAVDAAYVGMVRRAVRNGEIEDQIAYHKRNAARMESIHNWLEWLSRFAFAATCLACGIEVLAGFLFPLPPVVTQMLAFLCIVLPAFGAALFGIGVHGEFAVSAERSRNMVDQLTVLSAELGSESAISFATVSALTESAAFIMASEIGNWHVIYRARPLALPV